MTFNIHERKTIADTLRAMRLDKRINKQSRGINMCKCGHNHTHQTTRQQALSTLFKQRDALVMLINTGMHHMQDELDKVNTTIETTLAA